LTDVSLTLSLVSLDDLEQIIADFFQQIHIGRKKEKCLLEHIYILLLSRRKSYMLCEESDKNIVSRQSETNVNSVHHIHIHNANAMKQFVGHFPNVTELTLSENCDVFRDCTTTNFNRIIPLKQITKLAIDCHRFSFQRLMKLLSLTPNVHTLKLSSILLYETDALIIQQNEIFQMISTTNIVANVAVTKEIRLQKIELLFCSISSIGIS
jgi:hypothetical protein